jgi:hypothetical protein
MTHLADLISPDYLAQQKLLHAAPKGYGGKGDKWGATVLEMIAAHGCESVLDYGCGQGTLAAKLRTWTKTVDVREYDPAIKGKDALPQPADLVVCTDVIEHIEPDRLDIVLAHLASLARKALFVVIATRPASKNLPDGRNAHLIVEDAAWWEARLVTLGFSVSARPVSPSLKPSREFVAILGGGPHAEEVPA